MAKKTLSAFSKKALLLIPVIVLLAAGCNNGNSTSSAPSSNQAASSNPAAVQDQGNVKAFTVTGANYSFTPNEIKVNKGDKVKITFVNSSGFHDFNLDEFGVKTSRISAGQSADVEFTADKTGTFEYYCSVGNHRAMGMKGNLVVQ